ncbi:MAG: LysO family transporter [Mariniphaga sp.]
MVIILLIMLSGVIFGIVFGRYPLTLKINDKLLNVAICILLMLLGIAVGSNEKIIANLYSIGLQGFIISLGAIAGSVAFCYVIYKAFFQLK